MICEKCNKKPDLVYLNGNEVVCLECLGATIGRNPVVYSSEYGDRFHSTEKEDRAQDITDIIVIVEESDDM